MFEGMKRALLALSLSLAAPPSLAAASQPPVRVVAVEAPGGVGLSYRLRAVPVQCRGNSFVVPFSLRAKSFIRASGEGRIMGRVLRLRPSQVSVVNDPQAPVPADAVQVTCTGGKAEVVAGASVELVRR